MVALHDTPRHGRESNYIGFFGRKKSPSGAYALFCSIKFILHDPIHDPLSDQWSVRDPICDPVRDPIRNPFRSDPVRCRFC